VILIEIRFLQRPKTKAQNRTTENCKCSNIEIETELTGEQKESFVVQCPVNYSRSRCNFCGHPSANI